MAKAYFWYKKTVEELSNQDNNLIETHMSNLLDAMKEDSSKFLSHEWEKHPLVDIWKSVVERFWFPEWKIESPLGSIEFKKK